MIAKRSGSNYVRVGSKPILIVLGGVVGGGIGGTAGGVAVGSIMAGSLGAALGLLLGGGLGVLMGGLISITIALRENTLARRGWVEVTILNPNGVEHNYYAKPEQDSVTIGGLRYSLVIPTVAVRREKGADGKIYEVETPYPKDGATRHGRLAHYTFLAHNTNPLWYEAPHGLPYDPGHLNRLIVQARQVGMAQRIGAEKKKEDLDYKKLMVGIYFTALMMMGVVYLSWNILQQVTK